MLKTKKEKTVFKDHITIQEAWITDGKDKEFSRLYIRREDAAVVLIVNTDTNKVVLTRQFRCAVDSKINERILEIVAGKVDGDEEPMHTAIRESEEEAGYRIKTENIKFILSCFTSPGYSSERFFFYFATVTNTDKVAKGGGLKEENEYIDIAELDISEFKQLVKERKLQDAKTYLAGMFLDEYLG
ncbi:MAG: NUDIX hydrolase [Bacteroidia bacterium]